MNRWPILQITLESKLRAKTDYRKVLPDMKLAIRIFALSIAFAGVAAASVSSSTPKPFVSHQSANATEPVPLCAPGLPTCPPADNTAH